MQATQQTPLMKQFFEVKSRYPDALLFFRMGDFYELFDEDAKTAAKALEITLTTRNKNDPEPMPMCGVPHHSATGYIQRLVNQGFKVAICEQLEDPASVKGIVKRDVVRVVSPGTVFDLEALDSKSGNFTIAISPKSNLANTALPDSLHWSATDFSTGKFYFGASNSFEEWRHQTASLKIAEVLLPDDDAGMSFLRHWRQAVPGIFAQTTPKFYFDGEYAAGRLEEQFGTKQLSAIHPRLEELSGPVGALIKYFQETQKASRIPGAFKLELWEQKEVFALDPATIVALELLPQKTRNSAQLSARDVSLLTWIDRSATAMGGRKMRDWLLHPLTNLAEIRSRQEKIKTLAPKAQELKRTLTEIYDLERLLSKISLGAPSSTGANPSGGNQTNARDLLAFTRTIEKSAELAATLPEPDLKKRLSAALTPKLVALAQDCANAFVELPPATIREGGLFKKGANASLDELIELTENGERWLIDFETRERARTGINSLKVRYNRVFGYFIEITKANLASAPKDYIRKQTTVGGERFITEELKIFEEKILTAEKKRFDLEIELFREYCLRVSSEARAILELSETLATIDTLNGLALLSLEDGYTAPEFTDEPALEITEGVHPTVAPIMPHFVPNSVSLTPKKSFLLITGPNMGGKSTVMRQTALLVILAQMGASVPAKSMRLGTVDAVYTRIGANDDLASGSSTFMVEMSEMSFIIRNATKRSLILIDEIGRGTSTFDGLSLAWALASDIASRIQARTLFATHYHELTQLAAKLPAAQNARVAAEVSKDEAGHATVRFLYRLEAGIAERSYGILVARLAGLPEALLSEAQGLLVELEKGQGKKTASAKDSLAQLRLDLEKSRTLPKETSVAPSTQHPLLAQLQGLDPNTLTPLQALTKLAEWKKTLN